MSLLSLVINLIKVVGERRKLIWMRSGNDYGAPPIRGEKSFEANGWSYSNASSPVDRTSFIVLAESQNDYPPWGGEREMGEACVLANTVDRTIASLRDGGGNKKTIN